MASSSQDAQRNAAYEQAIQRAVELMRAGGTEAVRVLDIGAGSGLLSMMAARSSRCLIVLLTLQREFCTGVFQHARQDFITGSLVFWCA